MAESDEVLRARILAHMNEERKISLYDFLEQFKGIKLNRGKDEVEMTDITLDSLEVTYKKVGGGSPVKETIPIVPSIGSYDDARHSLILLSKEAANGLGYSAYQVKRFVPIRPIAFDLVPATGTLGLILSTFYPNSILPYVSKVSPLISRFLANNSAKILVGLAVVHVIEILVSMRPRLRKYRVEYPTRLYWILANFLEGYPALFRFDEEVNRINY